MSGFVAVKPVAATNCFAHHRVSAKVYKTHGQPCTLFGDFQHLHRGGPDAHTPSSRNSQVFIEGFQHLRSSYLSGSSAFLIPSSVTLVAAAAAEAGAAIAPGAALMALTTAVPTPSPSFTLLTGLYTSAEAAVSRPELSP